MLDAENWISKDVDKPCLKKVFIDNTIGNRCIFELLKNFLKINFEGFYIDTNSLTHSLIDV